MKLIIDDAKSEDIADALGIPKKRSLELLELGIKLIEDGNNDQVEILKKGIEQCLDLNEVAWFAYGCGKSSTMFAMGLGEATKQALFELK